MTMLLLDLLAYYVYFLRFLLIITAGFIVISSLDDMFIDILYWFRAAYRTFIIRAKYPRLDVEQLYVKKESRFAVIIPAWQEDNVIRQMLENTLNTYDYEAYDIFVGTYANDSATQGEVDAASQIYEKVHKVVVPHDGPTSKADCLNWLIQGIFLREEQTGVHYDGVVMHDAEDVVHRLELKLFNHLIERKDLMQLPVFSLERPWYEFTAGHYIDEFAESHSKDLLIREMLTGSVPSAGVATCFSRRAIDGLARQRNNLVFSLDSLTEDYDISFRLKELGMSEIFLRYGVMSSIRSESPFTGKVRTLRKRDFVATREYFPNSIPTAVRQKSRWILGIVFQGWRAIGWQGTLAMRYMLVRDRKTVLTSIATFFAYFILFNSLLMLIIPRVFSLPYLFPPLLEVHSFPWWLVVLNLVFFINRMFHRMLFTGRIYGWEQALLSVPRLFVSNLVAFLAVMRAFRLYFNHLLTKKPIVWDKTTHAYPSTGQLNKMRQRLGEALLDRQLITQHVLTEALEQQKKSGKPLGEILLEMDAVLLSDLATELGRNLSISPAEARARLTKTKEKP